MFAGRKKREREGEFNSITEGKKKKNLFISSRKSCASTADHIGRVATCQAREAAKYKVRY